MHLIKLDETRSTNTWLAQCPGLAELPHGTLVTARAQTAGRGQRGNSWESAPGANVTMSLLLRPRHIAPRCQQVISEAVAVAVADTLHLLLGRRPDHAAQVAVKWPNDIYVGDRKIAGILIEHTLLGNAIGHTIAGIGLNVNQAEFLSDAPNPVSLLQLTGETMDVDEVATLMAESILYNVAEVDMAGHEGAAPLHQRYLSMLWRRGVEARYRDTATGEEFTATLIDVAPDGMLQLQERGCPLAPRTRTYAFKEVAFIL